MAKTRYSLRILPSWPWGAEVIGRTVGDFDTAEEAHDIRRAAANGEHYEVIAITTEGGS